MTIQVLSGELEFPPLDNADPDGVLAVGGDLSQERLLLAYKSGIFPWYNEDQPILWWSPDPRFVLYPDKLKISSSMKKVLREGSFRISFDQEFETVMRFCKESPRKDQESTWINDEMVDAYSKLHESGYAHSVEVWQEEKLVGGLYGISLGRCFFGESMFSILSNASKVGFIHLVKALQELNFKLIDCQVSTSHLQSLGAELIPRERFLSELIKSSESPDLVGNWEDLLKSSQT